MFVFTVATNIALNRAFDTVFYRDPGTFTAADILIHSNSAAIFCTIMIIGIYESIYFMNELRKSVEEKEMLKRESLNAQLNALRTQVNPHFLFNNLNTLSSIIPENKAGSRICSTTFKVIVISPRNEKVFR
jgi:sensor histidine kinase YesM